jgi:hypothetical protein
MWYYPAMADELKQNTADAEKLSELRELMIGFFAEMDDVGSTIHPMLLEHASKIAELLDIDPSIIPTERQALFGGSGGQVTTHRSPSQARKWGFWKWFEPAE